MMVDLGRLLLADDRDYALTYSCAVVVLLALLHIKKSSACLLVLLHR